MSNHFYPEWTVAEVREIGDTYEVDARYDVDPEACFKCGVVGQLYKHGTKTIRYVDAPVHGRQTFVNVKRARYRCRDCGSTFMQPLPDMDDDRRMTVRCREYIERQCLLKPNTHVAEDVGINEKVVRQIGQADADRRFEEHAEGITCPRVLGIDELFLGGEMRAIFVNVETSWPIELLPSRGKDAVTNFLANLPGRHDCEIVTTDMWKPYKEAVQFAMPQAVLIVDKWHVMRMANEVMDTARKRFQGLLTDADRKSLKNRKSMFLRRPFQLSPKEQLDLDGWLKNTPELRGAYETKEAFMAIWQHRKRELAKAALDEWRATIPDHLKALFRPVVTATTNWETEILNYFDHGCFTNAATEARNRVIKMTNRLGAGYSFKMIRARALFGKRPGRLKQEAAAAAQAKAALTQCPECLGLFAKNVMEWDHGPKGRRLICAPCNRFHTKEWFNHGSRSTPKSE